MKKNLPKSLLIPHIQILIATIIWAGSGTVIKNTLNFVPLYTFLFLRFLLACILILPYAFILIKKTPVHKKDIFNIFLLGIFTHTSLLFIFLAYKYSTVIDTTIIGIIGSILTVAAGKYFYKDKISKNIKTGLIIASLGTLVVALEPVFSGSFHNSGNNRLLGNLFAILYNILNVISMIWMKISLGKNNNRTKRALDFIHLKPMKKRYPAELITTLSFFVGLLTFIPLAFMENLGFFGPVNFSLQQIGTTGIFGITYMAILSSIVAYIFFQKSLDTLTATDAAFYNYLNPVIATPIAYFFLGEVPNQFVIIGSIFIALGVGIAEKKEA